MKTLQGIKNENSLIIVNSSTRMSEGEIHPKDMENPPKLKAGFEYQTPGVYLASLNQSLPKRECKIDLTKKAL